MEILKYKTILVCALGSLLVVCAAFMNHAAPPSSKGAKDDKLLAYLKSNPLSPQQYVISKFKKYDVILLAEDHRIKNNLLFAQSLIPQLYKAGVYNFGMEFGASEDQQQLDSLVSAPKYDEDLARKLMFNYNVGWAFKEYIDMYHKAWEFNSSLPKGARKFRILNLSYKYRWHSITDMPKGVRTPESQRKVFYKGGTEWYRSARIKKLILDKNDKILILTGTLHALTRYQMPMYDYLAPDFYNLNNSGMGNLLYKMAPTKVFTILMHFPFYSRQYGPSVLVSPANGELEKLMAKFNNQPVGFDLVNTPIGNLVDNSLYAEGHPGLHLSQIGDGYVFLKPFRQLEGCSVDDRFLNSRNWPEALKEYPDQDMNAVPESYQQYLEQIRGYADVQRVYGKIR